LEVSVTTIWHRRLVTALTAVVLVARTGNAQGPPQDSPEQAPPALSNVRTVDISPGTASVRVGQELKFTAQGKDAGGQPVTEKLPTTWFAAPFDLAAADEDGTVTFFGAGRVRVGAVIGGKTGYATVQVAPAPLQVIEIDAPSETIFVGASVRLAALARTTTRGLRTDVRFTWSSDNASVAIVDPAGLVTGIGPGDVRIDASSENVNGSVSLRVVPSPVAKLTIAPRSTRARTGDAVRLEARAVDRRGQPILRVPVTWSVSGEGASIEPDGTFVAERPGDYVITAAAGEHAAVASIVAAPRNVARELEVVGRVPLKDVQAMEQWIFGTHAYVSTLSNSLLVYDISDPAKPTNTDTVTVDARQINDVSVTKDGRVGVLTREGAPSRRNGIVFLDTSDASHPKVISEYTSTVTGGVHSAFVDDHYVYLTDNATGSLRVIDFQDLQNPKEVARWEVELPDPKVVTRTTGSSAGEQTIANRMLHDVYVADGLAYLAYWRHGLIILDVGAGIKGGRPEKPQFVTQLPFDYHQRYGDGWLAGAHAVFRYKNYVFIGDEVFPDRFDIRSKDRIAVQGVVHVVDVSDVSRPRKVAEYAVPEAGAHNLWVENDVLYMGYYNGGGRVLDVSGELRGNLYRQGREIAHLFTGDPQGFRPNAPFAWGAQPHNGLIYFVDMNTGLWITRLKPAQ
jgi:hypothetical protein